MLNYNKVYSLWDDISPVKKLSEEKVMDLQYSLRKLRDEYSYNDDEYGVISEVLHDVNMILEFSY